MTRLALVAAVTLGACVRVSSSPLVAAPERVAREDVAVVGEPPDPACERVDDLRVAALDPRAAVEKLRAEAGARGANVLVYVGDLRYVPLGYEATGRALRCPPPPR